MNRSAEAIFSDFVGGQRVPPREDARTFDLIGPTDGQRIGRIAESGQGGIERAVKAASMAFASNRKQPAYQRIAWLKAAAARAH
jgi:acyl-CoA reductase-like NAD-dependent aldehyde dehydrogenase